MLPRKVDRVTSHNGKHSSQQARAEGGAVGA